MAFNHWRTQFSPQLFAGATCPCRALMASSDRNDLLDQRCLVLVGTCADRISAERRSNRSRNTCARSCTPSTLASAHHYLRA
eukprot:5423566-Pyramimonas_sp.AAC.2